jgi:hypothetical protein
MLRFQGGVGAWTLATSKSREQRLYLVLSHSRPVRHSFGMIKWSSAFRRIAVIYIPLIVPLVTFIPLIVLPVTFIALIVPAVIFIPLIGPSVMTPPPGAPRKYCYSRCGNGRGAHLDKHSAIHIFTSPFSFSFRRSIRPHAHTVYHCHKIAGTSLPYWGRILAHPSGNVGAPWGCLGCVRVSGRLLVRRH